MSDPEGGKSANVRPLGIYFAMVEAALAFVLIVKK